MLMIMAYFNPQHFFLVQYQQFSHLSSIVSILQNYLCHIIRRLRATTKFAEILLCFMEKMQRELVFRKARLQFVAMGTRKCSSSCSPQDFPFWFVVEQNG